MSADLFCPLLSRRCSLHQIEVRHSPPRCLTPAVLRQASADHVPCRPSRQALVKAGVTDIVLAVNYRPEVMVAMLKETEANLGIKITFSVESEPLGTGASLLCCLS